MTLGGHEVGGQLIQDVRFADDQAMVTDTGEGIQSTMNALNLKANEYGMKINVEKTKVMRISGEGGGNVNVKIDGQEIEQVSKYMF